MNQDTARYTLRITGRESRAGRFGWSICRQEDSLEVKRSARTFETRAEALADSVQAAMPLTFPLIVDAPSGLREAASVTIAVPKSDATKLGCSADMHEHLSGNQG